MCPPGLRIKGVLNIDSRRIKIYTVGMNTISLNFNQNGFAITQNQLKMLALLAMTLDHIGYVLLPGCDWLRIIGRLAFPIFSYTVWEGCRHTHNGAAYVARLLGLGAVFMAAYWLYCGEVYGNVLVTLGLSAALVLLLRRFKQGRSMADGVALAALLAAVWLFCGRVAVDYGFAGIMLPLWAEVGSRGGEDGRSRLRPLAGFAAGLLVLAVSSPMGGKQYAGLLALPLLAIPHEKRGWAGQKYFFYLYYPLHLTVIEGLAMIL